DRDVEGRLVVPGGELGELVLVLLPVVGVGVGEPGVEEDVELTVGETLEQRSGVELSHLDVIAPLLEEDLPEVGDRDVLVPRDPTEVDGTAFTADITVVVIIVVADVVSVVVVASDVVSGIDLSGRRFVCAVVVIVGAAGRQEQGQCGEDGDEHAATAPVGWVASYHEESTPSCCLFGILCDQAVAEATVSSPASSSS